ncbi:ABC transporter ATP-binding protein [Methanococcus voltae]|uniref:ABC transporter related protein n=1 Tax=Methanococcus voltae (strain ATCC BAA-1334 / A3) TaxID=456320 RepID=D7DT58_METV3|nr:ABC transporter ATP-binding protein [Methanococcus voltae]MCS3901826.1 iron complex transport system ATP-binding protein [Methanococcus voltae]
MLKTENLTVGYANSEVLTNVNLNVHKNEILCIIGPNGAGKSTLLKTIATYLTPKKGAVYINSNKIHNLKPAQLAKEMAVVLTDRINPANMTGYDVISIGRHPYTGLLGRLSKKDKEIILHSAELVNATKLLEKNFFEMSDGERQKIMIARALAQEPEILILDEPTSFLDANHKIELTLLLRKLSKKDIAIIVTLHDIELALRIADKMALVKDNKILAYGYPEDIMTSETVNYLYGLTEANYNEQIGYFELKNTNKVKLNADFNADLNVNLDKDINLNDDLESQISAPTPKKVFITCGGGTGAKALRYFKKNGYDITVGILHENDIDYAISKTMEINIISEKSFSNIENETFENAKNELSKCDIFVYSNFPVGEINQKNNELVEFAKSNDIKLVQFDGSIDSLQNL